MQLPVCVKQLQGTTAWPVASVLYTLLLALPFYARVVHPDAVNLVWLCKPKNRVKGVQRQRNLTGMPAIPLLSDDQYLLPELVGAKFDCTVLTGDALHPVANAWCRHALD
jgi:hypothetical protein